VTQPVSLPYGMRDIKVRGFTDATYTAYTAFVDFPNARSLAWSEVAESNTLRGDDREVASHESAPAVEWELEGGGLSFEACKVMYGGTIAETGVAPNRVKRYYKTEDDQRPYFYIEGQVISDSGGDLHAVIYKAKATGDLTGTFSDQEFFLTGASGRGIGSNVVATSKRVWEFVQNETITSI
jgi:hypothetical protein